MSRWTLDEQLGVFAAVLVVAIIALGVVEAITAAQCTERGWPDHRITITFHRYCVRRVDQTDVVARLDTLK